jgi:hypothetical protein
LIRKLRRRAAVKGPLGGSREWTLLWAVLVALRVLKRLTTHKPEILLSEEVRPGETLLITGIDREPRIVGGS